jgi:hypothetical protein
VPNRRTIDLVAAIVTDLLPALLGPATAVT